MKNDLDRVLISEEQLAKRIEELGKEIAKDYKDKKPHLVVVLRGAVVFLTDLIRKIDIPLTIDFLAVSSYDSGTKSSGVVKLIKDLSDDITDRDVIIVEDILDSGLTLSFLIKLIHDKQAKSVKICTLLNKPARRKEGVNIKVDYEGFVVEDEFVVGYGLDYDGYYRNLPYIGVLDPKIYS